MQTEQVVIDKIVVGGLGLGRMKDGMVFMAPYVLPDEKVLVKVVRRKKNHLEAIPVKIIESSPFRMEPDCPHSGICGGCDLQHAEYAYQLKLKSEILRESLLGAQVINDSELEMVLEKPIAASHPYNYRQRIRLKVKEGAFGFFKRASHDIERIEACPLAMTQINQALVCFRDSEAMIHLLNLADEIEVMASPEDDSLVIIAHLNRKPRPADIKAADQACDELITVKAIYLAAESIQMQGPYCGSDYSRDDKDRSLFLLLPFPANPEHDIPCYTLSLEAGGFSQVNTEQNNRMIGTILDWVDVSDVSNVLDLFGGMGNFSIPLAMKVDEVVGLDLQRSAIRSAKRNAENLGLNNCSFLRKSALEGISGYAEVGKNFDLVLLDPPRRGCREVLPYLEKIESPTVIYISCDPATLARDLKTMRNSGYLIRKIKMVDMFPQTRHLETMVLLSK